MVLLAASVALGTMITVGIVIASFGIGIITYTALNAAMDIIELVATNTGSTMSVNLLSMLELFGILDAFELILAALVTRASIVIVSRLAVGLT